jgi:predicted nucleotidyltransferase
MDNAVMNSPTDADLLERTRKAVLAELPSCRAIYVYGSRAQGLVRNNSDLDIAVLLPPGDRLPDRLALASRLASRLGMEIDLVDLRRASDVLRREVLASGIRIHQANLGEVLAFEAHALTRYGHYLREVADLLNDFHATGRGYGA